MQCRAAVTIDDVPIRARRIPIPGFIIAGRCPEPKPAGLRGLPARLTRPDGLPGEPSPPAFIAEAYRRLRGGG